jgi:hypothetical protein
MASEIKQEIGSSEASDKSLTKQSEKGSTHLALRSLRRSTTSYAEASVSLSDKSSGMEWKVKLG